MIINIQEIHECLLQLLQKNLNNFFDLWTSHENTKEESYYVSSIACDSFNTHLSLSSSDWDKCNEYNARKSPRQKLRRKWKKLERIQDKSEIRRDNSSLDEGGRWKMRKNKTKKVFPLPSDP